MQIGGFPHPKTTFVSLVNLGPRIIDHDFDRYRSSGFRVVRFCWRHNVFSDLGMA